MARTKLTPEEEGKFQKWYGLQTRRQKVYSRKGRAPHPDPDHPEHRYDYRGAFKAGATLGIDPETRELHWPDRWKDPDHPTAHKGR